MNKFEKLIEYVINDEDNKAADLFHEIVVEKSREIYEGLMNDEGASGDFRRDVEAEEEGRAFEAEEDDFGGDEEMIDGDDDVAIDDMDGEEEFGDEFGGDEEGEELEDRVVDLENQLDELMAEFESLMSDEEHEEEHGMDFDADGDIGGEEDMDMGDEDEFSMESAETDEEAVTEDDEALEEAISLQKVTKGIAGTTEGESVGSGNEPTQVNTKTINNDNSGARNAAAKPHQTTGEEKGRTAPDAKDMGYTPTQEAGKKAFKSQAPKPKTGEESGTNDKSLAKAAKSLTN